MIELSVNYAYIDAARCFDKLVRPDIVMSVPVLEVSVRKRHSLKL